MRHRAIGIIAREEQSFPPFGKQRFFFEDMIEATEDAAQESVAVPFDFEATEAVWASPEDSLKVTAFSANDELEELLAMDAWLNVNLAQN